MTKLELTLTKLRERAVILRQGRWSDGPEDAELMEHAADAIEQLERKNAKLRELVKAMEPFLCCMPFASCNTLAANVRKRMRELGVGA